VVESYAVIPGAGVAAIGLVSSDPVKVQDLPAPDVVPYTPSEKSKLALLRISAGIDVSAAASVDPAAKFLLDGAFESHLTPGKSRPKLDSHIWGSGYIRLASIASPGAVSGVSDVATYVKPLTDSTPAALVQSAEADVALEFHFIHQDPDHSLKGEDQPSLFSAVLNAGIITPLSQSQANSTIYIVSQQLYNYYTTASTSDPVAMTAIQTACGSSFDASTPCYVAYLPQDRTRFYRNYAAGLTYKKYYYNGGATKDDDSFGFPGIATLTIGQNEYVTRGQLRGLVLHAGASWPLAGNLPVGKWAGAIYAYGAIDMNLSGKNQNTQEYLLQTAGSSVTLASDRLAAFSVKQQDRDRYRFGIGVDVLKLSTTNDAAQEDNGPFEPNNRCRTRGITPLLLQWIARQPHRPEVLKDFGPYCFRRYLRLPEIYILTKMTRTKLLIRIVLMPRVPRNTARIAAS
jgi:hypothetical protein